MSGIFQGIPGAKYINIGNFDPYNFDPNNSNVSPSNFAYVYIDQVEVFKIPTAGSNISCLNSPIILGEGCEIPGATYSWTIDGGAVFANILHPTISPSTPTTYTLTVTLPDGSTHASDVTINDCTCDKYMYAIDVEDRDACSFDVLYYVPVYDAGAYDPAYGHNIQNGGDLGFTWSVTGQVGFASITYSPVSNKPCLAVIPIKQGPQAVFTVTMTYHYANGSTASYTKYEGWDWTNCPTYPNNFTYSVTPNPATSQLTITQEPLPGKIGSASSKAAASSSPIEVRLYNSFGKMVKEGKGTADQLVLDVQDLPEGIYYLRSGTGKNTVSKAIEVRH